MPPQLAGSTFALVVAEPIHAIGSGVSVAAFEAVLKRVRNISG